MKGKIVVIREINNQILICQLWDICSNPDKLLALDSRIGSHTKRVVLFFAWIIHTSTRSIVYKAMITAHYSIVLYTP
jgi:hypothetical protein